MKKYYCKCGKEINKYKIRCWDCYVKWSQIPENNGNYKHGKYSNNKKCIICGIKISRKAKKCNKRNEHTTYLKGSRIFRGCLIETIKGP
jgi:hypothetical protein